MLTLNIHISYFCKKKLMIDLNIKPTSNPAILKFEADKFLTKHQSYEYNNIDEAKNSPLAQQLFYLPFVKKVYIASNFIAIERYNIVDWDDVKEDVAVQIKNYLNTNDTVVVEEPKQQKIAVTVYAESTPNPSVLKFVSNKILVTDLYEFSSIDEAIHSPLATALFQFPFVKSLFFDKNYISITKFDIAEWEDITLELREFIKSHIESGKDVIAPGAVKQKNVVEDIAEKRFETLDDTSKQIVNILEEYVKPAVASDGGNIEFKSYNDETKEVAVLLQGACSGCPSSTFTLKNGIENMLKEMLNDQDIKVSAING